MSLPGKVIKTEGSALEAITCSRPCKKQRYKHMNEHNVNRNCCCHTFHELVFTGLFLRVSFYEVFNYVNYARMLLCQQSGFKYKVQTRVKEGDSYVSLYQKRQGYRGELVDHIFTTQPPRARVKTISEKSKIIQELLYIYSTAKFTTLNLLSVPVTVRN